MNVGGKPETTAVLVLEESSPKSPTGHQQSHDKQTASGIRVQPWSEQNRMWMLRWFFLLFVGLFASICILIVSLDIILQTSANNSGGSTFTFDNPTPTGNGTVVSTQITFGTQFETFIPSPKTYIVAGAYILLIASTLFFVLNRLLTTRSQIGDIPKLYVPVKRQDLTYPVFKVIQKSLGSVLAITAARLTGGVLAEDIDWVRYGWANQGRQEVTTPQHQVVVIDDISSPTSRHSMSTSKLRKRTQSPTHARNIQELLLGTTPLSKTISCGNGTTSSPAGRPKDHWVHLRKSMLTSLSVFEAAVSSKVSQLSQDVVSIHPKTPLSDSFVTQPPGSSVPDNPASVMQSPTLSTPSPSATPLPQLPSLRFRKLSIHSNAEYIQRLVESRVDKAVWRFFIDQYRRAKFGPPTRIRAGQRIVTSEITEEEFEDAMKCLVLMVRQVGQLQVDDEDPLS